MRSWLFLCLLGAVAAGGLVGCDEEAIVHPPMPPPMQPGELSGAPASRPGQIAVLDEPPLAVPGKGRTADSIPKTSLTLATLMEDYLDPLAKKAFKTPRVRHAELEDLLKQVAEMMPADDPKFAAAVGPKTWATIVDNALKGTQPK